MADCTISSHFSLHSSKRESQANANINQVHCFHRSTVSADHFRISFAHFHLYTKANHWLLSALALVDRSVQVDSFTPAKLSSPHTSLFMSITADFGHMKLQLFQAHASFDRRKWNNNTNANEHVCLAALYHSGTQRWLLVSMTAQLLVCCITQSKEPALGHDSILLDKILVQTHHEKHKDIQYTHDNPKSFKQ